MSVVKSVKSVVFVHNKKSYNVPIVMTNNKNNLKLLKEIFKTYTYYEFIKNFDKIYNNPIEYVKNINHDYNQRAFYWIYVICNEYKKIKTSSMNLNTIIKKLIKEGTDTHHYRLNDKIFNLHLIGYILLWRYYKINFNNINTVDKFNEILGNFKLTNLTKDLPELIKIFERNFKEVITQVNDAHKEYYESIKQQKLIEIENDFRNSFKEKFNEYQKAYDKLFKCYGSLGDKVHTIIFRLYNFDHCATSYIIDDMFKYGKYSEISKKYDGMSLDNDSHRITKILMKSLEEIIRGYDINEIAKELKIRFKEKERDLLSFYQTRVIYFNDDNIKAIRELIRSK